MAEESAVRNVSDTALWVAVYRAQESERKDALFYDPYARQLAGERGAEIEREIGMPGWPIVVRTQVLDEQILKAVEQDGFDTVLNLAAGLDTRPYRLALPTKLRWVEVDLPAMIEYKREALKDAKCFCRLERHALDLADGQARRALFAKLGAAANKVLVITEGLLIYLDEAEVKSLAADLKQVCRVQALAHGPFLAHAAQVPGAAPRRQHAQERERDLQVRPGGGPGVLPAARLDAGGLLLHQRRGTAPEALQYPAALQDHRQLARPALAGRA